MFDKAKQSIIDNGFCDPVLVREVSPRHKKGNGKRDDSYYEIIDGEHRYKAAESLGIESIHVVNMGTVSDTQAKRMTVQLNLKGDEPNDIRLSKLISEMEFENVFDASNHLPFSEIELEGLESFSDPQWDPVVEDVDAKPEPSTVSISIPVSKEDRARWKSLCQKAGKFGDQSVINKSYRLLDFCMDYVENCLSQQEIKESK
tara:strand:+ start:422 stop:1027 length:606 start_codon:yes stop_codon:yes gene_type:complete